MTWSLEFWQCGKWNTYPHAGPFADEESALAFKRRIEVNQRRSSLPRCEYRVVEEVQ